MIDLLVNHVKNKLGASHRQIEIDDEGIVQCLQETTLRTISIFFPFYCQYQLNARDEANKVPGNTNMYYLPEESNGMKLMSVEKVYPNYMQSMAITNAFVLLGTDLTSAIQAYASSKLSATAISAFMPPETFEFIPPKLIRLYMQSQYTDYMLLLRTTHKKDFSTVPFGLSENLKQLALADVCSDLLGIRSFFQNISTTFGEINLNIDFLQQQVEKKDELIELMRKNQIYNAGNKKIWIA